MARSRNIKPGFFTNDLLAECDPLARILFAGLWTIADREGRLEDRPKRIKAEILPYDNCDAAELLTALDSHGFIRRYEVDGRKLIQIVAWHRHQKPHHMEKRSEIPPPDGVENRYNNSPITKEQRNRIFDRDGNKCKLCGSKKKLHLDHITPITKGGTSDDENLRVLCEKCNLSKGNRPQVDNESTTNRSQVDHAPLIPDSLNTDSLNTDSLSEGVGVSGDEYSEDFEQFWNAYPAKKRLAKLEAWIAWGTAIKTADPEQIIAKASEYARSQVGRGQYARRPSNWLDGRCWEDDPQSWNPDRAQRKNRAPPTSKVRERLKFELYKQHRPRVGTGEITLEQLDQIVEAELAKFDKQHKDES